MEEKKIQLEVYLKLLVIIICTGLYAWGGMEMKWLRRFLAPSICGLSLWYFTRDWRGLIVAPFLGISSSLGYGADETWLKILKRGYVGLAFGLSGNAYNFFKRNILVIVYTTVLIVSAFIVLGVWNPLDARHEETFLGLMIYAPILLSAKS